MKYIFKCTFQSLHHVINKVGVNISRRKLALGELSNHIPAYKHTCRHACTHGTAIYLKAHCTSRSESEGWSCAVGPSPKDVSPSPGHHRLRTSARHLNFTPLSLKPCHNVSPPRSFQFLKLCSVKSIQNAL